MTRFPLTFDKDQDPNSIYLFWTDGKSIKCEGFVELQDLKPVQPKKKGIQVMLLAGPHAGEIVKVIKVMKATENVLVGTGAGKSWDVSFDATCIVEDHMNTNCASCSKWVTV